MPNPRVFIMGAGFGGLPAVKKLSWASCYAPFQRGTHFVARLSGSRMKDMTIPVPRDPPQPIQFRHAT
jgi:NADH dehydrogenase FAD-containing subunit